jgi:broad specificity phosphatase PhoE
VYASDLRRALETASIVAEPHGAEITVDRRLREFDFGNWEGLTWDEIVERWPDLRDAGATAAKLYAPDGGETFEAVCARIREFFDEMRGRSHEHALVVTHAGPLHAIMTLAEDAPVVSFSPASLTELTMDAGGVRLINLNDVRHLDSTG